MTDTTVSAEPHPGHRCRGRVSRTRRAAILRAGACHYCGGDEDDLVVDHVIPVAQGGTDQDDNLVAACWPCNTEKAALLVEEWAARRIAAGKPWPPTPRLRLTPLTSEDAA